MVTGPVAMHRSTRQRDGMGKLRESATLLEVWSGVTRRPTVVCALQTAGRRSDPDRLHSVTGSPPRVAVGLCVSVPAGLEQCQNQCQNSPTLADVGGRWGREKPANVYANERVRTPGTGLLIRRSWVRVPPGSCRQDKESRETGLPQRQPCLVCCPYIAHVTADVPDPSPDLGPFLC